MLPEFYILKSSTTSCYDKIQPEVDVTHIFWFNI